MKRRLVLAGILVAAILAAPIIGKGITPTVRAEEEDISAEDAVPFEDVAIDETHFPDENFREFILYHIDTDKDKKLSDAEIASVTNMYMWNKNVVSLKGIEYFTALEIFRCDNASDLGSLDLSKNTNLKSLNCAYCNLSSLDLSKNTALTELVCNSNKLTSLDLSKNTNLKSLDCAFCNLSSLDLSKNTALTELKCNSNQLTSLDLSKNPNLISLDCAYCNLPSLDLSKNVALKELVCYSNKLESLDVSKNTALEKLYCYSNKLVSLDLSKNAALKELVCYSNKLTSLDASKNSNLTELKCSNNQLTSLDVNSCSKLRYLFCNNNELTSLDVSKNYLLRILYCYNNKLTSLNIDDNDCLISLWCYANQMQILNVDQCVYMKRTYLYGKVGSESSEGLTVIVYEEYISEPETFCDLQVDTYTTILPEKDNYTVLFDPNGGVGMMESVEVSAGEEFELPESKFKAPEKMEFDCWDLGKPGDSVKITKDTVIKAQWKEKTYAVKVTTDGHGVAIASVEAGKTGTEVSLKAQPNEGYLFKEWQVVSGGVTITDDKFVIGTEDVEIKAIFEAIPATPTPTNTPTPKPGTPSPTTKPGDPTPTTKPGDPTPTPVPGKEATIADFVERLYTIALNRASEPEGKAFWVKEIEEGNRTGGDCAYFFLIESPEFKNRGLSDEDFVETLYLTFFDRKSEADGKAFWVGQLKNKTMTRDQVIMGFIDSKEWCNVCADYGVKSGAPTAKAERASKNAINFATRLYTCCLGREPEEAGLKYWSLALTNLEQTGCSAAKEFFTCQEFVNFKLKDDEYVKRLYRTFMDREPKVEEVTYWTGEIAKGNQTRASLLAFFGQSEEFTNICKKYGIDRGTI